MFLRWSTKLLRAFQNIYIYRKQFFFPPKDTQLWLRRKEQTWKDNILKKGALRNLIGVHYLTNDSQPAGPGYMFSLGKFGGLRMQPIHGIIQHRESLEAQLKCLRAQLKVEEKEDKTLRRYIVRFFFNRISRSSSD